MWKVGKKIRGQDGRVMSVLSPLKTIPISYLVEFEDAEIKIVTFKHPDSLEHDIKTVEEAENYAIQRLGGMFEREMSDITNNLRRMGFEDAESIVRSAITKRASEIYNKYDRLIDNEQ